MLHNRKGASETHEIPYFDIVIFYFYIRESFTID